MSITINPATYGEMHSLVQQLAISLRPNCHRITALLEAIYRQAVLVCFCELSAGRSVDMDDIAEWVADRTCDRVEASLRHRPTSCIARSPDELAASLLAHTDSWLPLHELLRALTDLEVLKMHAVTTPGVTTKAAEDADIALARELRFYCQLGIHVMDRRRLSKY